MQGKMVDAGVSADAGPQGENGAREGGGKKVSSEKAQARKRAKLVRLKKKMAQRKAARRGENSAEAGEAAGERAPAESGRGGDEREGKRRRTVKHPMRVAGQRPGERCFSCGGADHAAKDCPKRRERKVAKACLFCRQWGHVVSECPRAASAAAPAVPQSPGAAGEEAGGAAAQRGRREQEEKGAGGADGLGVGICYNCGSTRHRLNNCPLPRANGGAAHAVCFVCQQRGHLSRDCPQNPNGLYPKGGCCRICGLKTHLARDCPSKHAVAASAATAPARAGSSAKMGMNQGSSTVRRTLPGGDDLGDDFGDAVLQPLQARRGDGDGEEKDVQDLEELEDDDDELLRASANAGRSGRLAARRFSGKQGGRGRGRAFQAGGSRRPSKGW
ncbi:hypothetical protein CLOM_g23463 [Closterium sp. NIES-68]|nr:hypothetical protein CLOM_g23463 [Closterium sp. NIES-68]GJP80646.1 hypothetical protein CLOP_g10847 [Closterium sp. NIES-67]